MFSTRQELPGKLALASLGAHGFRMRKLLSSEPRFLHGRAVTLLPLANAAQGSFPQA